MTRSRSSWLMSWPTMSFTTSGRASHHGAVGEAYDAGLALETVLITLGFFLADRILSLFSTSFGLHGKSDVAAMPLLVLTAGAVSLALLPLFNAFSRSHERRADRYALEMTRNVPAFVSAMKRLAAQNLAEDQPSRLVEVLFYTHPPIGARVAAARNWAAEQRL